MEFQTQPTQTNQGEDSFQKALLESEAVLKNCQREHNLSSCMLCPKVLKCPIRLDYVKNVYLFLNQGQSESDFDF